MLAHIRSAPLWALPFLICSVASLFVGAVVILGYVALVGLVVGAILAAKDMKRVPELYMEDPPTKSWDGVWAGLTVPNVDWRIRTFLLISGVSMVTLVAAVAGPSDDPGNFAWGVLIATGALAGVESAMRHHRAPFKVEAAWVAIEAVALGAVAILARPLEIPDAVLGAAAAGGLELCGFMTMVAIALGRAGAASESDTTSAMHGAAATDESIPHEVVPPAPKK